MTFNPQRIRKCLLVAIAATVFVACATTDFGGPGGGSPSSTEQPGSSRRIGLACVASQRLHDGTVRSRPLSDAGLKKLFGDHLGAQAISDSLHAVLVVHHFSIGNGETGDQLTCALPARSLLVAQIAAAAASGRDGEWENLRRDLALGVPSTHERGQKWIAATALRALIAPHAKFAGRVRGLVNVHPIALPIASPPEGFTPSTQPRPPQVIPEIFVTGTQTQWTIDFNFLWQTTRGHKSFSELIDWEYYLSTPQCPPAESLWRAKNAEADSMQVEAENVKSLEMEMEQAAGCIVVPGKPLCIDLFIMNSYAALIGLGDARNFGDTGKHASSRVVVYINPATGAKEVKWHSSSVFLPTGSPPFISWTLVTRDDSARIFNINEDVVVDSANGWLRVTVSLRNNFCISRSACPIPPIDASVMFEPNPSAPGGYNVWWKRDAYPSMEVKMRKADNTGWDSLATDREASLSKFWAWTALIWNLRQSNHLPPGCYET